MQRVSTCISGDRWGSDFNLMKIPKTKSDVVFNKHANMLGQMDISTLSLCKVDTNDPAVQLVLLVVNIKHQPLLTKIYLMGVCS